MERPSIENPEEYVKKHLQKEEEDMESEDLSQNLSKPLFEYSFDQSGKIEMEVNGLTLSFEYVPIEPLPDVDMDKLIQKQKRKKEILPEERHAATIKSLLEKIGNKAEVREITSLQISNGSVTWDYKKEVSEGGLFVFNNGDGRVFGQFEPITRNIYLGNLKSAQDFISLFHETGHNVTLNEIIQSEDDMEAIRALRMSYGKKLLPAKNYALLLDVERTAWAYAIRRIIPFINNLQITLNDIMQLKDFALQSCKGNLGVCISDGEIILFK